MTLVRDILARKGSDVVTVGPGVTALDAAQLMNAKGIGAVLVLEDSRLLGIFTERDILRRVVAEQRDPATVTVRELMSTALVTATMEMPISECGSLMTSRRIRHLPVMSGEWLAGVITIGDLLAFQVSEQADTIAQLNSYVYDNR